jgi:hypothetical protein
MLRPATGCARPAVEGTEQDASLPVPRLQP